MSFPYNRPSITPHPDPQERHPMNASLNRRQLFQLGAAAAAGAALRRVSAHPITAQPASQPASNEPVRLQSNENPYGPSRAARQAMEAAFDEGCRYPARHYHVLAEMIADREGLTPDHVVPGAGSHEVLQMAAMAYGLPSGEMISGWPTYEAMGRYMASINAHVHRVPLDDELQIDLDAIGKRLTQAIRLIFICNPNNPTGRILPGRTLESYCTAMSARHIVFSDEAYHEYVDDPEYRSMIGLVKRDLNVIVSRTFSKVHGLAGLRIGYGLARPDIAERLRRFQSGSSINILGLRAAIASYQDDSFVEFSREKNAEARELTCERLIAMGHRCLPSQANFVFFRTGRPIERFREAMLRRGFSVGRPFPPYRDWCRLSIGTPDQMRAFMTAFEAEMGA
jgi:histidinol-phosphate aminotransferase